MEKIYDVIILGGGPASMSAGVYCKQMGLDTLLIEKGLYGGQVATTSSVTNYLGFEKISGKELSEIMHKHTISTGIELKTEEIVSSELSEEIKIIKTHSSIYKCKTAIIGIGTSVRNLGVDNEKKFIGHGISFSSLRDRDKFVNKVVAVVGGGNSAVEDAIYLSEKCKKVYLIHRRQEFRADKQVLDDLYKAVDNGKVELVLDSRPHSLVGNESITGFNVIHIPTGEIHVLQVDGIFVAIGRGADTDIIDKCIDRDSSGYIITNDRMETNTSGVYAVGDIRNTPLRQIVTAVSDGAIASVSAFNYLKNKK